MAKEKKQDKPVAENAAEPPREEIKVEETVVSAEPRWVKVTKEQLNKLQLDARLIGYNPETGEALIK